MIKEIKSVISIDEIKQRGFVVNKEWLNAHYPTKIGSYNLYAMLSYQDGEPVGAYCYKIWNSRRQYYFISYNGKILTKSRTSSLFDGMFDDSDMFGVPNEVVNKLISICG